MSKRMLIEVHVGKRYGISRLNCDGSRTGERRNY